MITSVYPVLMSDDVAATADFFRRHFAFETVFEADWYVSLAQGSHELAVIDPNHTTVPDGYGKPAAGLLVNIEVEDVDAVSARLVDANVPVALSLRSEDFGQRHTIVVAPGNVLVDVIQPIPYAGEFA